MNAMQSEGFDSRYDGYLYHYYRAEVYRETNWRNRLDVTTNWSIVVTAAILSYTFGNENVPHGIVILNYLLVMFFLYIESRRFRYYTMLKTRTRMLEEGLLSNIFYAISHKKTQSMYVEIEKLALSLGKPKLTMSRIEALAWRTRRVYIFLFVFLFITWLNKLAIMSAGDFGLDKMVMQATLWFVPGWIVVTLFGASVVVMLILAFYVPLRSTVDDLP